MTKRWIYSDIPRNEDVMSLSKAININPTLASILVQRGINDFESAKSFFRPDVSQLHDPYLMADMDKAVARLKLAIQSKQRVLVYGDYDVDGTTAVALVFGFLRDHMDALDFYINDRDDEGYGISEKGINYAIDNKIDLIITLDCGIKAGRFVELAKSEGIDFIICDHHTVGEELPPALAVLDPKRDDCSYPFDELSGCGVGFKLLQALCTEMKLDFSKLYDGIDLLAVSIAADIVPIVGENRVFCHLGLQKLRKSPSPGLKALLDVSSHDKVIISTIVFGIAPRINAAGRIAHARLAVELLLSKDDRKAAELSKDINTNNSLRRDFDVSTTNEALEMIRSSELERKSTVLFKENWHKGVVGIVASRCIEHFHRPTIILTGSNGTATGSARSVPGYNIYEAILKCENLLEKFGGHKYAAGLSLSIDNLDEFKARFESIVASTIPDELLIPPQKIDSLLDFDTISTNFVDVMEQMEPFGPGNSAPVFETNDVYVLDSVHILKEKHVKFRVGQKGNIKTFEVIGFGMADLHELIESTSSFRMAYSVEYNFFRGMKSIQLKLKDIKFDN